MGARRISLEELLVRWESALGGGPSIRQKRRSVRAGLRRSLGSIGASVLTPHHITRWLDSLDVTAETARGYLGILREALRWGAERELAPVSVWHASAVCRPPARLPARRAVVQPPRPEHVELVLAELRPVHADPLRLARLTGARIGEVVAITLDQVERDGEVWWYRPRAHKRAHAGAPRWIAVGPRARTVLEPWLDRLPWRPEPRKLSASIQYQLRATCDRLAVPRWHAHQLRHASGTEVRARYGRDAVPYWLGHVSARTVSDRYTLQAWEQECRAVCERIAREIG